MGLIIEYIDGQTPIDEEEKDGLLIESITNRGELNEFEQYNIEKAIEWILSKSFSSETILTEIFIKELHRRMFNEVWEWAGSFRKTNKNIGVDKYEIGVSLKNLLDDSIYWLNNKTFGEDEFAIRFKHRLVQIHCFPNGNGRHSRLMADVIISQIFKKTKFTWGSGDINKLGNTREKYIKAVQQADNENINPLLDFSKS
jgi:Fic-DOC domain mobile mystery protein B